MINQRAIILTALRIEYQAVRAHLTNLTEESFKGTVYERGQFLEGDKVWEVWIVEVDAGNSSSAFETERAIGHFNPAVALFVGVAGGVKDVGLGDVIAATKVYGYESGKTEKVFKARPDVGNSSYSLVQRAKAEARKGNWTKRIKGEVASPKSFVGPIAAGEKVIAETESELFQFLKLNYNDTLAVEMEGRGFFDATHANEQLIALIVRGVSDQIDNKSDIDDAVRQDVAARHASAFAFEVLANLNISEITGEAPVDTFSGARTTTVSAHLADPPAQPEIFLGRDQELAELKQRLGVLRPEADTSPVQVLTALRGWPGIGKTATATVLARDPEIAKAFPDGVLWTSLGSSPSMLLELDKWGRALGTDKILRALTVKEAISLLASHITGKRLLLVVDDVWEVEHVVPFQDLRGSGNGSALLITTRQPGVVNDLSLPEKAVYNLPALTEGRALELLAILVPTVVAAHADECLTLARDVECLPLALHVAGRLLNSEAKLGWGVDDLIKELREGARLIAEKAPAEMMDYESQTIPTVAALLQKSTDRLDEVNREYFARLGPFAAKPASFNLDAMKDVWEVDDPKPIARTLVEHGLLEPLGGRFQMHALLVAHARSLLIND